MSESMSNMLRRARYDAVVVGGGVVGLAVARALQLGGLECCLLEAQEHLAASGASAGNTGIACTSPDAARGSLERTLLERAEALNLRAYEAHGVPHRAVGAAYAAWRDDEVPALRALYEAHGPGRAAWVDLRKVAGRRAGTAVAAVHVLGEVVVEWRAQVAVGVGWRWASAAGGGPRREGPKFSVYFCSLSLSV